MNQGKLTVFMGPMSSGKSRELINVYLNQLQAKEEGRPYKNVVLIKNAIDTRKPTIHTRDSRTRDLEIDFAYSSSSDLKTFLSQFEPNDHIVLVDEFQFPTEGDIAGLLDSLATEGFEIYVSALPTSFNGTPFSEHIKDILTYADDVKSFKATCATCGNPYGLRTFRTNKKGDPDRFDAPVINVGFDNYSPVCRKDHIVPERPKNEFYCNLDEYGLGKLIVISGPISSAKSDMLKAYLVQFSGQGEISYYTSPPNLETLSKSSKVVLIDNYHKLENGVQEYAMFLDEMATRGYFIAVAGDPLSEKNTPTKAMRELLPLADEIFVKHAYERVNGEWLPATKTIEENGVLRPVSRYTFNKQSLNS